MTVAALVAAVLSIAGPARASTADVGIPIKLENSGKCLNVAGDSGADGAKIIQYTCEGGAGNEAWSISEAGNGLYYIVSYDSGKCLTVQGASTADKASLIQFTCTTGNNELWKIESPPARPTMRLISAGSGKCVNVPGGSTANNVNLVQYTCQPGDGAANERVTLPPTTSPAVVHRPFTGKEPVAAIQGGRTPSGGTAPVSYSWIDGDHQWETVTDYNPDVFQPDPKAPVRSATVTDGYGYTGHPTAALLGNDRVQVIAHEAAAGDVQYRDEATPGTGTYGDVQDIGGAMNAQPAIGAYTSGRLAYYAIIDGHLWDDPEYYLDVQPPVGGWRDLGGSGLTGAALTGVPAAVPSAQNDDARIFAQTTAGGVLTAELRGRVLDQWQSLPAVPGLSGMSALPLPDGGSLVTATDSTGTVRYLEVDSLGTYPDSWSSIPGVASAGTPSAVIGSADGKLDIAIRGSDNLLYVAQETAPASRRFGGWTQISDPAGGPDTVAATDPTAFAYDVPSGKSFGVVFQSTTSINGPYGIYFAPGWTAAPPAAAVARTHTGLRYHAVAQPKR